MIVGVTPEFAICKITARYEVQYPSGTNLLGNSRRDAMCYRIFEPKSCFQVRFDVDFQFLNQYVCALAAS